MNRIQQALEQIEEASSIASLRGIEGSAARAYFSFLRLAVHPEMRFGKRARRPPPDPANALFSLGYALLNAALMSALEIVGLDPYIGFFHAEKYGRPALALDLVEEFRAPIVDSLVLTLINKRMIGREDFEPGPKGGVYLNRHALRVFFREFSDRLETSVRHPLAGRSLSYRKVFEIQARVAAKTITGQVSAYRPFAWW